MSPILDQVIKKDVIVSSLEVVPLDQRPMIEGLLIIHRQGDTEVRFYYMLAGIGN